jgi:hypothetical protein
MVDLATAASVLNIAEKITALVRWALRKLDTPTARTVGQDSWDFEVRPIGFSIDLTQQLPFVEVRFYLINYLTRPLILAEVKVAFLHLSAGPILEHVPLVQEDFHIAAKTTELVTCRRNLMDEEVRALLGQRNGLHTASIALVAKGRYKKREYKYRPVASLGIEGWVVNTLG